MCLDPTVTQALSLKICSRDYSTKNNSLRYVRAPFITQEEAHAVFRRFHLSNHTQTYGYPYLYLLNNLETVGLLKKREKGWVGTMNSGSSWPALRRLLRLVNDSVDVQSPDDVAYVSSGYVFAAVVPFA